MLNEYEQSVNVSSVVIDTAVVTSKISTLVTKFKKF